MLDCSLIKTYGFSYKEAEDLMATFGATEINYDGCIVSCKTEKDDWIDFAEVVAKLRPEFGIRDTAISIHVDCGYIYTRRGIDILVIDGIQEEY